MYYIVGLGNPGAEYTNTRHNVGWLVLKQFIKNKSFREPHQSSRYSGSVSNGVLDNTEVAILFPDTFMNHSGSSVAKLVPKSDTEKLIVICDDVDLPIGEVKVSYGKSDGGHKGVKSIITHLTTKDFIRLRIGISPTSFWTGKMKRPQGDRLSTHVLGNFNRGELKKLAEIAKKIEAIITVIIKEGKESAMNRFN